MKFSYTVPVGATAESTWAQLQDPIALIRCMPGVEDVEPQDDGHLAVILSTGLGPIRLRFRGSAQVRYEVERRQMQADVTMSDSRSGSVYGQFLMAVQGDVAGVNGSELVLTAEVAIGGKLGEFAQPLLKRKADQVVKEFAARIQELVG